MREGNYVVYNTAFWNKKFDLKIPNEETGGTNDDQPYNFRSKVYYNLADKWGHPAGYPQGPDKTGRVKCGEHICGFHDTQWDSLVKPMCCDDDVDDCKGQNENTHGISWRHE